MRLSSSWASTCWNSVLSTIAVVIVLAENRAKLAAARRVIISRVWAIGQVCQQVPAKAQVAQAASKASSRWLLTTKF